MNSKKSNRFSPEVRERAVRMVQEHRGEYPSLWACIESIAPKIGCIDPAETAQVKLLKHTLRQGFAFSAPDVGAGGYRSRSNHR